MRNTSTQPRRKRREDKIDWEELQHAPNVDGMLSYLQRPASNDVIAPSSAGTVSNGNGIGNASVRHSVYPSESLGSTSLQSDKVSSLPPSEKSFPRLTRSTDFPGVGKRHLHRCTLVQDAHSPGEQVILNCLYRMGRSPRWGRSQADGSFLVNAGLRDIAEQACMHETNVRFNLRNLIAKLAIEIIEEENRKRQTARVYRIFSYKQILERRRASGLEWVIKNRGVRFISREKVEEILASETLPSDFTAELDELASAPLPERGSESLETRGSASLPPILGSKNLENYSQQTSSSVPHDLAKGLYEIVPVFDEEAVVSLWKECRIRAGDCTTEEVLYFAKEKSLVCRNGKIQNPVGFLLAAVPKCFEGHSFAAFRLEQKRRIEEQQRLETKRRNAIRIQEEQIAREAEAYRKAEEKLQLLPKDQYDSICERTKGNLLKEYPEVRRYPAGELEKLVKRRVLATLQEQELRGLLAVAEAGRSL